MHEFPEPWLREVRPEVADHLRPIEWSMMRSMSMDEIKWAIPWIAPQGSLTTLYGPSGSFKSMLLNQASAAAVTEQHFLDVVPDAKKFLVLDAENCPTLQLAQRFEAMGYQPDEEFENLTYIARPSIAALDTDAGARELIALALKYESDVVVLDPISAFLEGDDDKANTWNNFRRRCCVPLLRVGLGVVASEHSGKDQSKKIKGSSQKFAISDYVWKVSRNGPIVDLQAEKTRGLLPLTSLRIRLARDPLGFEVIKSGRDRLKSSSLSPEEIAEAIRSTGIEGPVLHREVDTFLTENEISASREKRSEIVQILNDSERWFNG